MTRRTSLHRVRSLERYRPRQRRAGFNKDSFPYQLAGLRYDTDAASPAIRLREVASCSEFQYTAEGRQPAA